MKVRTNKLAPLATETNAEVLGKDKKTQETVSVKSLQLIPVQLNVCLA